MKTQLYLIALIILFAASNSFSQYQMLIQNGSQISSKEFDFDVYINSTSGSFDLTSYQLSFTFNSLITNGGTLSFAYQAASSGLSYEPVSTTIQADGVSNLVSAGFGSAIITTTPVKVGRFKLINTANFANAPLYINWDFAGNISTEVNISNNLVTVPAAHLNLLSPYHMIIDNDQQTSDRTYEFDVSIVSTSIDFTLTSYQVALNYNSSIVNGGTLSFSYLTGTTTLSSCLPLSETVVTDGSVSNLVIGSNVGSQVVSTTPLKIGRVRVTNTVPFGSSSLNLKWDFTGSIASQVNISNTNLTDSTNHMTSLTNSPLPIELYSFSGKSSNDIVKLDWETKTEVQNVGFDIERASITNGVKGEWQKLSFVNGSGNSNSPKKYFYTDKNVKNGDYAYRLKQVDINGSYSYSSEIKITVEIPLVYNMDQNYPNPFNPSTTIKYQLPYESKVIMRIYNAIGQQLEEIVNDVQKSGYYTYKWNASNYGSGVYFVNLTAKATANEQSFSRTMKMLLVK